VDFLDQRGDFYPGNHLGKKSNSRQHLIPISVTI
jgi:hypothetical protein